MKAEADIVPNDERNAWPFGVLEWTTKEVRQGRRTRRESGLERVATPSIPLSNEIEDEIEEVANRCLYVMENDVEAAIVPFLRLVQYDDRLMHHIAREYLMERNP